MTVETGRLLARPVFIIGVPRSGTTMLFTLLAAAPGLFTIRAESHFIWLLPEMRPFHPAARGWRSGVLTADEATAEVAAALERAFYVAAVPNRSALAESPLPASEPDAAAFRQRFVAFLKERNKPLLKERDKPFRTGEFHVEAGDPLEQALATLKERQAGGIRFLDKTPANCLRVGFLAALFPDALFIYIKRDGPGNVNSLMEGWRVEAGRPGDVARGLTLPVAVRIPDLPENTQWRYVLPPGWQAYVDRPLEEVATFQWMESNGIAMDHLATVDATRVHHVSYEDLVERTAEQMEGICAFIGVPFAGAVRQMSATPPVMAAHTPPEADKWRRQNGPAIARMLPLMAPLRRAMGYSVEP